MTQGFSRTIHEANDFVSSYGTFLVAPFNAKIITIRGPKEIDNTTKDLEWGCGVLMTSTEDPTYRVCYWHCLPVFPVREGDYVLQGDVVAQMGNTGWVESNGKLVPLDLRLIPPYIGTHVHISMGIGDGTAENTENVDYSSYIDWTIPVKYDLLTAIRAIIINMANIIKGR